MSIKYIHNNGSVYTKDSTNLFGRDEVANVLIHFASADGKFKTVSSKHVSFLKLHGKAVEYFDYLASKGEMPVGKVLPRVSRKGQESEKLILIGAHKGTIKEEVNIETVATMLRAIYRHLSGLDPEKTIVAVAPIGGHTPWDDKVVTDEEGEEQFIPGLGKLYAQYFDSLECEVHVYIGQYATEYYGDGTVVTFERPKAEKAKAAAPQFLPDADEVEEVTNTVAPQTQDNPENDPFLPEDFPGEEEVAQPVVVEVEPETNMKQALVKAGVTTIAEGSVFEL